MKHETSIIKVNYQKQKQYIYLAEPMTQMAEDIVVSAMGMDKKAIGTVMIAGIPL